MSVYWPPPPATGESTYRSRNRCGLNKTMWFSHDLGNCIHKAFKMTTAGLIPSAFKVTAFLI